MVRHKKVGLEFHCKGISERKEKTKESDVLIEKLYSKSNSFETTASEVALETRRDFLTNNRLKIRC